jgi:hypothetical protein
MKYLYAFSGLCVGIGIGQLMIMSEFSSTFKVGQCVRDLGHDTIETVSTVTARGAVETTYTRWGTVQRDVYKGADLDALVKVNCK